MLKRKDKVLLGPNFSLESDDTSLAQELAQVLQYMPSQDVSKRLNESLENLNSNLEIVTPPIRDFRLQNRVIKSCSRCLKILI